jgi:ribosomal protein S18 acetylase RimI-like enzyme
MLTIRDVEPRDVAVVRRLLVTTWHATYDPVLGREKVTEITDSWHSLDNLGRQIGVPGTAFLVAERDGEVIATSYAAADGDAIMLRRLYVLPAEQRRGVGRALLAKTLARFPAARTVSLEVERANAPAIRFYERNGFAQARLAACCGDRSDIQAIIMEKALQQDRSTLIRSCSGP